MDATTPTNFTATVGTAVDPAPTVRVRDASGSPVRGVLVNFQLSLGGGAISNAVTATDVDGLATVGSWTLGTAARVHTLRAVSSNGRSVVFTATGTAGPIAKLTAVSGSRQEADAGTTLATPLAVLVTDSFGNPVSGAAVAFTVVSGGGTLEQGATVTGTDGKIHGTWTLGPASGIQVVKARAGDHEAEFTAVAFAVVPTCTPAACGVTGKLAFVRQSGIFAIEADGSRLVELNAGQYTDSPTWSRDGSRIAFSRRVSSAGTDLFVMNADGSNLIRRTTSLSSTSWNTEPAWSPDGKRLAYLAYTNSGPARIYAVSADEDGMPPALLFAPSPGGLMSTFSWSPEGNKVAFTYNGGVHLMNPDGSGLELLTLLTPPSHGFFMDRPSWSPDGKRLAVTIESNCDWENECDYSIGLLSASGSDLTLLVRGSRSSGGTQPAWSPDGTVIAFTEYRYCNGCSVTASVGFVKVDGSGRGVIVADGNSPSWRP